MSDGMKVDKCNIIGNKFFNEPKIDGEINCAKEVDRLKGAMKTAGIGENKIQEMLADNKLDKKELGEIVSGLFRWGADKNRTFLLSEIEAAKIEIVEVEIDKYLVVDEDKHIIVLKKIESGKLSINTLFNLAMIRTGHLQDIAEAAMRVLLKEIPKADVVTLEEIVVKGEKEYYTYDAPVEKVLLAAIKTEKLSKGTLERLAGDNSDHKRPVRKAALEKLAEMD